MSAVRKCLGLAVFSLIALPAGTLSSQETFDWSERMSSGNTLVVKGIVGDMTVTLASDDQAEVVAYKRGDRDDFHHVAVEVAEDGGDIYVCVVYGDWKHGQGRCHPDYRQRDDDERRRGVDIDVEVDYEVRVPAGVEFEGSIVSGDIRAEGLRSDVEVHTVDGEIYVETTGQAWANTVSGDIELDMGDFGGGDLDFNTVSGDITLWLPSDFSADLEFSSLSGDLDSDFEVNMTRKRSRWIGSHIEGTIGGGGRDLSFNTVSGDVELRRKRR